MKTPKDKNSFHTLSTPKPQPLGAEKFAEEIKKH